LKDEWRKECVLTPINAQWRIKRGELKDEWRKESALTPINAQIEDRKR